MSKYWDPSWAKESLVLAGTPNPEVLQRNAAAIAAQLPDGYQNVDTSRADGLNRVAIFGPDYIVLTPSATREAAAELQQQIGRMTYYFICSRPRVRGIPDACRLADGALQVTYEITRDDGSSLRKHEKITPVSPDVASVHVSDTASHLVVVDADGREVLQNISLLVQTASRARPYKPSELDLKVHYIGRARGRTSETCALDRLANHEKYITVMEMIMSSAHRNREVWLGLASGTTFHMVTSHRDSSYSRQRAEVVDERARRLLTTNDRIDVTEALLINYFKPALNTQHVNALDLKGTVVGKCRRADITGLTLATSTTDLGIALVTEHVPAKLEHAMTIRI